MLRKKVIYIKSYTSLILSFTYEPNVYKSLTHVYEKSKSVKKASINQNYFYVKWMLIHVLNVKYGPIIYVLLISSLNRYL